MNNAVSSYYIFRLLKSFCPDHLYEEIEGDLIQRFQRDENKYGAEKAKRRLIWNAIRFFRPGIILRNRFTVELNHCYMLRNYFKVAGRHLAKSKTFSVINIAGLAVGMTAFFLILQYVSFEMSYDRFHENKNEIYRVGLERYKNNELQVASAKNFVGARKLIGENFPGVDAVTGFYKTPANTGVLFSYKEKIFNEAGGEINADSSFFRVFPGLLVKGDPMTALNDPHSIVVSESMARKIFGDAEPIGQHIQRPSGDSEELNCVVTGVLRDIPVNAHFHANFVVPLEYNWMQEEWQEGFLLTYITLKKGTEPDLVADKINQFYDRLGKSHPKVAGTRSFLQPLTSIHLSSNLEGEVESNGSKTLLYVASSIGLIILVIAWINYVNLETARFVTRAREIGVRRIIGSGKSDLALQFLVEYFCVLMAAVAVAIVMLIFIFPHFSYFTGIPLGHLQLPQPEVLLASVGVLLIGSFLVGIYPAVFLLRLNPIATLKGNFGGPNQRSALRRSLLIVQFCASLVLIAFVLIIHSQLDFMRFANKKFDVEQVIAIRNPTAYSDEGVIEKHSDYKTLTNKLTENASVKMVTSSSAIPGTEIGFTYINLLKRNANDPYDPTPFKTLFIDYNYIPFYGLKLLAGRNFNSPRPVKDWKNPWEDEHWLTLILNESAIRALGFNSPEEAVDQIVEFENFGDDFQKHKIIGVVADYHHEAVKKAILPMILSPNYGSFQQVYYSVRLNSGTNLQHAIADIEKSWKAVFPEKTFEYFFLNDYYDHQFKSELHFGRIFGMFAGIAIFIACLGILGMTLFEANSRLKEISIRKVLGASGASLVALLSRDNIRLVIFSAIVAMPVIYFVTEKWLSAYPIRIQVSPLFFLMPLGVMLFVVMLTSSFQTIKAAHTNPVDHLKHE